MQFVAERANRMTACLLAKQIEVILKLPRDLWYKMQCMVSQKRGNPIYGFAENGCRCKSCWDAESVFRFFKLIAALAQAKLFMKKLQNGEITAGKEGIIFSSTEMNLFVNH